MTPQDLLAAARELIRRADPATVGLWPRASALLGRQALELALGEAWQRTHAELAGCSTRIQLLCLRGHLPDPAVAKRAAYAWAALSRACHHRPYALAPTAMELTAWLDLVDELLEQAAASSASPEGAP
jgi:hypothetical protein